jgi:L-lactate dehydrogenase (cytochrome)
LSRNVEREFGARDHLGWDHFTHIRRRWSGPLIVKGLLHADDVRLARKHGADGVIVSNHGGRQLDGAIGALRALPAAVEAAGNMPVMIDGGFRRGSDVLKALALGARMVFVGRPLLYAAVAAGEAGVALAIERLRAEVDRNMALLGLERLNAISPDFVRS